MTYACQLALEKENKIIRVLHVDDDPSIREISKQILLDLNNNLEIESASCVDEALEKLETNNYDIIISDYEMPLKNGLDFLKQIREQQLGIPFILFTGKGREEIVIKALNLGADGYINKQGNPETVYGELSHCITSLVASKKAELQVKQTKALLNSVINATNDMIWSVSAKDFRLLTFNKAVGDYFLRTQNLQVKAGMTTEEIMPTAELAHRWRELNKRVLVEGPFTLEYITLKEPRTLELNFNVIRQREKPSVIVVFAKDITARKKAEEASRKQQQQIENILDSSPMIIFFKDANGRFIQVNKTFAERLKTTKNELLGKTVFDIYPSEIAQALTNDDHEVFKTKQPKLGIVEQYESSAGLRWMRTHKVPTFGEKGEVNGLIGFSEDINELKIAQMELEQKSETLERVAQSIDSGLVIIGKDYRVIWANSILARLGLRQNQKCFERLKRNDVCPDCGVRKIFKENAASDVREYKTVNEKGETRFVELRATPLKDRHGNVTSAIELAVPVTERKKAEQELSKQNSTMEALLASVNSSIFAVDRSYCYTIFNQHHKDMMKKRYDVTIELGKSTLDYQTNSEDRERTKKNIDRALNGEIAEDQHETGDSNHFRSWISSRHYPIKAKNGEIIGAAIFVVDVTDLKREGLRIEELESQRSKEQITKSQSQFEQSKKAG